MAKVDRQTRLRFPKAVMPTDVAGKRVIGVGYDCAPDCARQSWQHQSRLRAGGASPRPAKDSSVRRCLAEVSRAVGNECPVWRDHPATTDVMNVSEMAFADR